MGLRLKQSKTRLTHTLQRHEGNVGFDFLGFNVRQYPVGKHRVRAYKGEPGFKTIIKPSKKAQQRHLAKIKAIIRRHVGAPQAALIGNLNPVIRGWSQHYRSCVAKRVFTRLDHLVVRKLLVLKGVKRPTIN